MLEDTYPMMIGIKQRKHDFVEQIFVNEWDLL